MVHTSTVTVAVLDPDSAVQVTVVEKDLKVEWYSGSGAGGQHRNKHQNSCRMTHVPTGLVRKAETRSRENSRRLALEEIEKALAQISQDKNHQEANALRRGQVGSGMRGDKRRTYRFQEDTVKDHVSNKQARCSRVLLGEFDQLWP